MDYEKHKKKIQAQLAELEGRLEKVEAALDEPADQDLEDQAIELEDDEVLENIGRAGVKERNLLNAALADFCANTENCFLVDVRPFINQPEDVTDNLRHYQPRHYRTLAQQVAEAIGAWRGQQLAHSAWADWRARLWNRVPAKLRNLVG